MFVKKKNRRIMLDIMTRNNFCSVLMVERARTDRNGPPFSLVLFEISDIYTGKYVAEFVDLLKQRKRMVDCVGWFDLNSVGVILHSADYSGASQFVRDVERLTPTILPAYTIFCYPEHWFRKGDDGDDVVPSGKCNSVAYYGDAGENDPGYTVNRVKKALVKPIPFWKRVVDIIGSLTGLVLLSPVFVITALYIKLVSPGPVFFTQKRVGYKGELFTFIKFRTMHVNNDESRHQAYLKSLIGGNEPMAKLDTGKKDSRIFPGGEILRKSCVDELPQLFNVLCGDMSLIGPRPCLEYEAKEFSCWHHTRFDVMPGMTGLWQVSGKNSLPFKKMIRLDIEYGRRMSLLLDLRILLFTVPTVLGLIFDKLYARLAAKKNVVALPESGDNILNFGGNISGNNIKGDDNDAKERTKQSV